MKKYFILLISLTAFESSKCQQFAIALDKMNIFYAGVSNPITIAVENTANKSLVVTATNGKVVKENGQYIFRSNETGTTSITIYKKVNNKLHKIGSGDYRIKPLPVPVFKFGGGGQDGMNLIFTNQRYVSAVLENCDFEGHFTIDNFTVCIVPSDTCNYKVLYNRGGEINKEILKEFKLLKENDVIIFKNIFAHGPDGKSVELEPKMIKLGK